MDLGDSHCWTLHLAERRMSQVQRAVKPASVVQGPRQALIAYEEVPRDQMLRGKRRAGANPWTHLQRRFSRALTGKERDAVLLAEFGYSADDLRRHIERQFVRDMTWANYAGNLAWNSPVKKWHVDHIVAKSRFDFADRRTAYALSNLRPLWSDANMAKGARRVSLL